MKKTYIQPSIRAHKIKISNIMQTSLPATNSDPSDKKADAKGMLDWSDDFDEE